MKFSCNSNQKQNLLFLGFSFVSSFLLLMICTRSSFLYPMNDWVDAQCFFTVGKVMGNGQVLYRDIMEQKGILLYVLYMFAYFISHTTFIGVFFLEVISGTFFMFINIKIMQLYTDIRFAVFSSVICSTLIYTSISFYMGGSTEELCLPFLAYTLYLSTKAFKSDCWLSKKQLFTVGILSACVLWIKYTMLGFFIGWIVVPLMWLIYKKRYRELWNTFLYIALGVFVATLPVLVYFAVNHSLQYLWDVYFYQNIFRYSNVKSDGSFVDKLLSALNNIVQLTSIAFKNNLIKFMGLLSVGLVGVLFMKGKRQKFSIFITLITLILFTFGGGIRAIYYGLPLSVFTVFGFIAIYLFVRKIILRYPYIKINIEKSTLNIYTAITFILTSILGVCIALKFSYNIDFINTDKEDLVQYQFKEIICQEKNPTLLQYETLDAGFYTVCDIVPNCRCFCGIYANHEEIVETQKKYIKQGKTQFVITRDEELPNTNYECVAEATHQYLWEDPVFVYRLYKLK